MALIVEDGTGKDDAESYIDVTYADAYWVNHNNTDWAGYLTEAKEAALRYATRWMDGRFSYIGDLLQVDQALGWPRVQGLAYVSSISEEGRYIRGIPEAIKEAECELAYIHIKTFPLNQVTKPNSSISAVTAGPVSVTFDRNASGPVMDYLNGLLREYIIGGGAGGGISFGRVERS